MFFILRFLSVIFSSVLYLYSPRFDDFLFSLNVPPSSVIFWSSQFFVKCIRYFERDVGICSNRYWLKNEDVSRHNLKSQKGFFDKGNDRINYLNFLKLCIFNIGIFWFESRKGVG